MKSYKYILLCAEPTGFLEGSRFLLGVYSYPHYNALLHLECVIPPNPILIHYNY